MERKDYCGAFWMPVWLRKLLSNKFNASCKIHDLDYSSKKYSRLDSDIRFKNHMLRQAKSSKLWKLLAHTFYLAVRLGGKISWKVDK